jgi:hypothetical protein
MAQVARVWITEFATARVQAAAPFANLPTIGRQPVLDVSESVQTSAPFHSETRYIRIVCEVQCAFTADSVATTGDILLPALRPEYFGVHGCKTISVIAAP